MRSMAGLATVFGICGGMGASSAFAQSIPLTLDSGAAQLMSAALVGSPDLALRYEAEVEVERLRELRMRMRAQGQMSTLKREPLTEKTPHVVSYGRIDS